MSLGVVFALIAMFSWGVGDFLIEKSTRRFGSWASLFFICIITSVVLLPFVYQDLPSLFRNWRDLSILLLTSVIILVAAFFDFEALRQGKISVVEPVCAIEVPVTVLLAGTVIRELPSLFQGVLILCLVLGIFLVTSRDPRAIRRTRWERGVWLAAASAIAMGSANFLFGFGGRETSPLLINWFTDLFLTAVAFGFLWWKKDLGKLWPDWRSGKKLIVAEGIMDNTAWIAYTYSVLYIPISVSISISESYIALAAGLGLVFNKEKLKPHQLLGLGVVAVSVILLARTVGA